MVSSLKGNEMASALCVVFSSLFQEKKAALTMLYTQRRQSPRYSKNRHKMYGKQCFSNWVVTITDKLSVSIPSKKKKKKRKLNQIELNRTGYRY